MTTNESIRSWASILRGVTATPSPKRPTTHCPTKSKDHQNTAGHGYVPDSGRLSSQTERRLSIAHGILV